MSSNPNPLLLDTSIQIERLISPNSRHVAIERHLAAPETRALISHYVLMETQRSVWSDYIHVYNQILQRESWEASAYALRSGVLAYRPRSLGRCLQILTQTMFVSRLERDHGLDLLETQIRRDLSKRFWAHVTPLPDPIGCDLVATGVQRQPDGTYTVADTCRKRDAACRLPDFLSAHEIELRALADHLAAHPNVIKDQPCVERLLTSVLDDPRAALGQNACWPLGDVIIALQVPPNAAIWTTDPDFGPLTEALGLRLFGSASPS